jgi:hypothetical protein
MSKTAQPPNAPLRKVFTADSYIRSGIPNPTSGDITVKTLMPGNADMFCLGRKLVDKATQGFIQQVSISSFSQGVYFLKLFTDSGNKLIKLEKR